jgi:galacturan 1,4-alpha-galacturonidase
MLRHALLLHVAAASTTLGYVVNNGTSCYVYLESLTYSGQPVDDTPSILQAFDLHGTNGSVILTKNTLYIDHV